MPTYCYTGCNIIALQNILQNILTWTLTSLQLITSTIPTTSSKTRPIFLQLSAKKVTFKKSFFVMHILKPHVFWWAIRDILKSKTSICMKRAREIKKSCIHTHSDGVDLSLYLQSAVVALEGINHLFKLRFADHKSLSTFMVLLLITMKRNWVGRKEKKQLQN